MPELGLIALGIVLWVVYKEYFDSSYHLMITATLNLDERIAVLQDIEELRRQLEFNRIAFKNAHRY